MHQFLAQFVHFHNERIDLSSQIHISCQRRNRNKKPDCCGEQRKCNAAGKLFRLGILMYGQSPTWASLARSLRE